ncbi:Mobile element protein [Candidatus Enterovibrio altilux]|uniref:Mobile element protein n=1 Tax=Candidatus Enterovibrio altilux TaxID=1927128 RepID=A0A291B7J0_9GAMM|nr:Mobile element protein [Candidatus Enterovibrio luxaltus]
MVKYVFAIPLRGLHRFINAVFTLSQLPLSCHHYSCISKDAKTNNVTFKMKSKGTIKYLVIDSTELKVYGKGE